MCSFVGRVYTSRVYLPVTVNCIIILGAAALIGIVVNSIEIPSVREKIQEIILCSVKIT